MKAIIIAAGCISMLSVIYARSRSHDQSQVKSTAPLVNSITKDAAQVVLLAEAFKATLTTDQLSLLQLEYSKKDAVRWSNFPQGAARPSRVGISIGSFNSTQLAAFTALMSSALSARL